MEQESKWQTCDVHGCWEHTANITKVESQACITVLKLCDNRHPMTTIANLSMKEGSLFCSYEIHGTGMLQIAFLVSLESSRRGEGCMGLVSWRLDSRWRSS